MAKVTLILEDTTEADGTEGMIVEWKSDDADFNENSLSHVYAKAFVEMVVSQAGKMEIIDKDSAGVTGVSPGAEEDPGLN